MIEAPHPHIQPLHTERRGPRPELAVSVTRGQRLDTPAIRALWELRGRIFGLKAHVDPDEDWAIFRDELLRSSVVLRFTSGDGVLRGFWQHRHEVRQLAGRHVSVLLPTYSFVEPAWRGHPSYLRALASALLPHLLGSAIMPSYAVGVGYPMSFMLAARHGIEIHVDRQARPGSLDAAVLDHYRAEMVGPASIASSPRVDMRTVPEPPSAGWLLRHAGHPLLRQYEAHVPDWLDGYALYVAIRFRPRQIARVARGVARRMTHRR